MRSSEPLLTEGDVHVRWQRLREAGYPEDQTRMLVEQLVRYARGRVALDAVRDLAPHIASGDLDELVGEHVMEPRPPGLNWDRHFDNTPHIVWERLEALGYKSRSSVAEGWVVEAPNGEVFSQQYHELGSPPEEPDLLEEGEALCRLALLVLWTERVSG